MHKTHLHSVKKPLEDEEHPSYEEIDLDLEEHQNSNHANENMADQNPDCADDVDEDSEIIIRESDIGDDEDVAEN